MYMYDEHTLAQNMKAKVKLLIAIINWFMSLFQLSNVSIRRPSFGVLNVIMKIEH